MALYPQLRRFAAAVCAPEDEPDDYVQEAFVRALLRRELHDYDNLGAYLRRTIVNLASNRRRGLARGRAALARLRHSRPLSSEETYPSDLADLRRVDSLTRAVLYLVDVEGWRYAEVARVVGVSEEAARARASRARQRLSVAIVQEEKT